MDQPAPVRLFSVHAARFARVVWMVAVATCCSVTTAQIPTGEAPRLASSAATFSIPFQVDPSSAKYIEVQLYLSSDQGRNWKFHQRQDLTAKEFQFESDGDGEYWFALKTLTRDRQLVPPGNVVRPDMKVVVDTVKPKLEFQITPDAAGRINAQWNVVDANIDPKTLQLAWQPASAEANDKQQWQSVLYTPARPRITGSTWRDQLAFWPDSSNPGSSGSFEPQQIRVRISVADVAGNLATATRETSVRQMARRRNPAGSTTTQHRARNPFYSGVNDALFGKSKPAVSDNNQICRDGVCFPLQPKSLANRRADQNQLSNSSSVANAATNKVSRLGASPGSPERREQPGLAPKRLTGPGASPAGQGRAGRIHRVGSDVEYVAPPVPEDAALKQLAANRVQADASTPAATPPAKQAIPWESKINRWTGRRKSAESSTLVENEYPSPPRDPIALRQRYQDIPVVEQSQPKSTNQIVTRQSTREEGDLVVSESTAFSRGRPPLKPQQPKTDVARLPDQNYRTDSDYRSQPLDAGHANSNFSNTSASPNRNSPPFVPAGFQKGVGEATGDLPQLNVNSRRFNLNYDIKAIDPSGVGKVILWATEDGGRSWQSWSTDPDNTSPFPVEVKREGIYGFKVVINSRDGLTGKPPVSGEQPDVLVHVDLTVPRVAITSAPYGSGPDAGKLIINFEAADPHLTIRPIRLFYSPTPDGPWTTIENGLRNTGTYGWKVPAQVPGQIYLRIEARDTAGNFGAYQLTAPLDISGLVPRGRIYSVDPIR